MTSVLVVVDLAFAAFAIYLLKQISNRRRFPLPPGPKGVRLVGNVLDMPQSKESEVFTEWGKRFGGIIYVRLFGQPVIILNSARLATEMLDKKSAIYSDRPRLVFGGEMVGWDQTIPLTPYGDKFREYRSLLHQFIGTRHQVKRFHSLTEVETRRFLQRVLEKPDHVHDHIRHTAGSLILKMAYGYDVQEDGDPCVEAVGLALDQFSKLSQPGAFLVDVAPVLRYVPSWLPGAGFKKTAELWHNTLMEAVDMPYNFVQQCLSEHISMSDNFTSDLLEKGELDDDKDHLIKWSAASLYGGGADTTVSANYSFFLAMTCYPEVQKKAQDEIERVIGTDRLPTFADREDLPYVEALVTEVFRWNPVAPLGLPHRLLEDDIHAGYFIPKGSIVVPNISGFLHDPDVYEDPSSFLPERFLPAEGKTLPPDSRDYCFGFGRRICPGMHFADASVWITCAMTLAAFDISKVMENGTLVEPAVEYTGRTISHPKPFRCTVKPRTKKAETLILAKE